MISNDGLENNTMQEGFENSQGYDNASIDVDRKMGMSNETDEPAVVNTSDKSAIVSDKFVGDNLGVMDRFSSNLRKNLPGYQKRLIPQLKYTVPN